MKAKGEKKYMYKSVKDIIHQVKKDLVVQSA